MFCGGKKPRKSKTQKLLKRFQHRFRFPENKLAIYIDRYNRIGSEKGFTKEEFRENMGLLGLDSTCLIANRIFTVMNLSQSGKVSLEEYLEYMDILLNGTPDEKSEQSFKLITNSESDGITYEDFVDWIVNIWKMYNSLTGCEINSTEEDIKYYFDKLDREKDGVIDLQEYKEAMAENINLYEWFEFANRGIADEQKVTEIDQSTYNKALGLIGKDLEACLNILNSNRNSRKFSNISLNFPRHESDVFDFNPDELEKEKEEYDRPVYNNGDEDLPDEFVIDDNRISIGGLQGKIASILIKVENLLSEKDFLLKRENTVKNDSFPNIVKSLSNHAENVSENQSNLVYNMMIGVQRSVKIAMAAFKPGADLTPSDFLEKSDIPLIKGNNLDNSNLYKFKDYAAGIFERLRREYELPGEEYLQTLGIEKIVHSIIVDDLSYFNGKITKANHGHFFFHFDKNFILKTISSKEFKCIKGILTEYFYHMVKNHNSFIVKLLGIHRITSQSKQKHYFIVMSNIFQKDYEISEVFDLQGVEVPKSENLEMNVKKDLEFNRMVGKICVGEQLKKFIYKQLKKDCEFLSSMGIIEYSLILGLHDVNESLSYKDMWVSEDKSIVYFIGIVDFMTQYSSKKKIKNMFKRSTLSIPPKEYSERLLAYLDSIIV